MNNLKFYRIIDIKYPTNLADIEGRKGKIECKVESVFIACLLRLEAGKLFGIAYAELDLEAGAVFSGLMSMSVEK